MEITTTLFSQQPTNEAAPQSSFSSQGPQSPVSPPVVGAIIGGFSLLVGIISAIIYWRNSWKPPYKDQHLPPLPAPMEQVYSSRSDSPTGGEPASNYSILPPQQHLPFPTTPISPESFASSYNSNQPFIDPVTSYRNSVAVSEPVGVFPERLTSLHGDEDAPPLPQKIPLSMGEAGRGLPSSGMSASFGMDGSGLPSYGNVVPMPYSIPALQDTKHEMGGSTPRINAVGNDMYIPSSSFPSPVLASESKLCQIRSLATPSEPSGRPFPGASPLVGGLPVRSMAVAEIDMTSMTRLTTESPSRTPPGSGTPGFPVRRLDHKPILNLQQQHALLFPSNDSVASGPPAYTDVQPDTKISYFPSSRPISVASEDPATAVTACPPSQTDVSTALSVRWPNGVRSLVTSFDDLPQPHLESVNPSMMSGSTGLLESLERSHGLFKSIERSRSIIGEGGLMTAPPAPARTVEVENGLMKKVERSRSGVFDGGVAEASMESLGGSEGGTMPRTASWQNLDGFKKALEEGRITLSEYGKLANATQKS
ncbi:hypothetical protein HDU67_006305 [Dinochytrium kinnereticum]|nr:hypothetical protein HDU67_006305 [Dinochytrium kinnereticum]